MAMSDEERIRYVKRLFEAQIQAKRNAEKHSITKQSRHAAYKAAGFDVFQPGVLKREFYIDVVAKEPKIDTDFYDYS